MKHDIIAIQRYYEDPKACPKPAQVLEKFPGLKYSTLNNYAKKYNWVPAWKSRARSEKLMQKKLDTALSEEVEELVERKLKEVREKMFEAGMSGLEQFAQFAPIPKDYSDAIKCADLAERGLGVKEGEKEEMVVNFNLLSTPRVVQVDV